MPGVEGGEMSVKQRVSDPFEKDGTVAQIDFIKDQAVVHAPLWMTADHLFGQLELEKRGRFVHARDLKGGAQSSLTVW